MLDGVHVDTVEEKAVVALKPKPAFKVLFQIATTKEGCGIVLYNEKLSLPARVLMVRVLGGDGGGLNSSQIHI
jgi:hypothetical protein